VGTHGNVEADPDKWLYYRVVAGKLCVDGYCVCTKAIVELGDVESPRENPLVVKATKEIRKSSRAGYLGHYLESGDSSFLSTSRIRR
jgi:hypothetical protein